MLEHRLFCQNLILLSLFTFLTDPEKNISLIDIIPFQIGEVDALLIDLSDYHSVRG